MNWFYAKGDERFGPVSFEEIEHRYAAGELSGETLIWQTGLPAWVKLSTKISAPLVPGMPPLPSAEAASYPAPPPPPRVAEGDSTGGVIPYKNPRALASYYTGIFSLIPILGLLPAIPAIVLGVLGWKKAKRNPAIKGQVHAIVGIVCGGFSLAYHFIPLAFFLIAACVH